MPDPYLAPRAHADARPLAIKYFRAYAGCSALAYVGAAGFTAVALGSPGTATAFGALGAANALAAFVPFRPWGWTAALVVIGLGAASPLFLLAWPLYFAWSKPTVKAAFGRPP